MTQVVGVDGCSRGWICWSRDETTQRGVFAETFSDVIARFPKAAVFAVDMPIGLVDEERLADAAARAFLTGQASSVFNAPPASVLTATSYAEASAASRKAIGKGLSRQSYNLLDKIREVDAYAHDARVFEVHPEVSFRLLGEEKLPRKKSWSGFRRRASLLESQGTVLPDAFEGSEHAAVDDVLDACVAAWSGARIARGEARSFPKTPTQRTPAGRVLAIWA